MSDRTYQPVYAQKYKVYGYFYRLIRRHDRPGHRLIVPEQVREQSLFVRRIAELIACCK